MRSTLTVEPGFKSSHAGAIEPDAMLPIGEAAELIGVAPSTLRYYERRGLVASDARVSGQRRYGRSTVRRLVFVQMLQDAGLSLDEIEGVLDADDNASWKGIARQRLAQLDDDIAKLSRSRELLAAALLCRYDHPLDECRIMNGEIDRRLVDADGSPDGEERT
jgi:MerR family transcriptional regulator, copper efflux regulator